MSDQPTPEITVILIAGPQRERSAHALASILAQEEVERAEIILIDVALDRFPPLAGSDQPQVRTIQMGYEMHFGELRAYATLLARSPLVAYIEEHALALPGWLKAILHAFARDDWAAVSGVAIPADPKPGWGMLINLLNFYTWAEGTPSGKINYLPGHNTAYRRDVLLSVGDELGQLMLTEMLLQDQLRKQGYKLYLENECRWIHLNEKRANGLCFNYFCWNVVFGHQRIRGRSPIYRILRLVTTPLILPVRTCKSLLRVGRRVGREWRLFPWWMPSILLIHLAETLGLGLGYLGRWSFIEKALTIGEVAIEREPSPRPFEIARMPHVAAAQHVASE